MGVRALGVSKREELVEKALQVFYSNGFHATGMDKLVAETGISKTSMYKHFRTKEELILATLRLRDEQFRNMVIRRVEALADTPRARLLAFFDVLVEWLESDAFKSCMFIKASSEFQEANHPIHRFSAEHKRMLRDSMQELAEEAGAPDPAALARRLMMLKEGAIITAHLHGADGVGEDARTAASTLITDALGS